MSWAKLAVNTDNFICPPQYLPQSELLISYLINSKMPYHVRVAGYIWNETLKKKFKKPWLAWLSWLSVFPLSEGLPVWFPVNAHGLKASPSWGSRGNPLMSLFLSFSLPSPLSKNKYKRHIFKKDFTYLFLEGWKGWRKRSEISMCERYIQSLPLTHPNQGPALQPRHVPCLGIELVTPGLQADAQSTKPHQPGLKDTFFYFHQ